MSKGSIRLPLADLRERVQRVDAFTMGMDREAFSRDAKTVDAVVRNLCVIGWIASRLPATYRDACQECRMRRDMGRVAIYVVMTALCAVLLADTAVAQDALLVTGRFYSASRNFGQDLGPAPRVRQSDIFGGGRYAVLGGDAVDGRTGAVFPVFGNILALDQARPRERSSPPIGGVEQIMRALSVSLRRRARALCRPRSGARPRSCTKQSRERRA